jgi:hypothetical protein
VKSAMDELTVRKRRTVLYEELAEYYYKSVAQNRLLNSDINREISYHVQNITLLSLYFDHILITSATIFNVRDEFVSKVIATFLKHHRIREMLQLGVIKIAGWGGENSAEMLDSASEYSQNVLGIKKEAEVLAHIKSVFIQENVVSRSTVMPDTDLSQKYMNRLENTTFVSRRSEIQKVFDAVQKQHDYTGSLIAIEMLPSLDQAAISLELLNTSKLELFGVTIEHMRSELPDLWVYSPFLASNFALETTHSSEDAPRAFLLSPMVFGSFLGMNIDSKAFELLMNQSYHKLQMLKNGDWGRFVDAYHQAVSEVSGAISLGMHLSSDEFSNYNSNAWAEKVIAQVETNGADIDVATFIESLGSLGGVILAVPFLKPLAKLFTVAVGDKLSIWVSNLSAQQKSQISPFISKLEKAYLN